MYFLKEHNGGKAKSTFRSFEEIGIISPYLLPFFERALQANYHGESRDDFVFIWTIQNEGMWVDYGVDRSKGLTDPHVLNYASRNFTLRGEGTLASMYQRTLL